METIHTTIPHLEQKAAAAEDLQKAKSFMLITEDMQSGEVVITTAGENPFILSIVQNIQNAERKAEREALGKSKAAGKGTIPIYRS